MRRRVRLILAAGAVLLIGAALALPGLIGRRVRERLQAGARGAGVSLDVGDVAFSWLGALRLREVRVSRGRLSLNVAEVTIRWRPSSLRPLRCIRALRITGARAATNGAAVSSAGPAELEVLLADSDWRVERLSRQGARLRASVDGAPAGWLSVDRDPPGAQLRMGSLDLSRLLRPLRRGRPVALAGTWSGRLWWRPSPEGHLVDALFRVRGLSVAQLLDEDAAAFGGGAPPPAPPGARGVGSSVTAAAAVVAAAEVYGLPVDADASASATLDLDTLRLTSPCWSLSASGLAMEGRALLSAGEQDLFADVDLTVSRVDLSNLFQVSGLEPPPGLPASGDLGSAALEFRLVGHARDPKGLDVEEKLSFRPPSDRIPAIEALRGPFVHEVDLLDGRTRRLVLRPFSPDYVALAEVPPLLVRALTIAEDAAFWGHRGLDLKAIPVAFAINWNRGERSRGASTITQQLAKNLFLTRRKSYGRKVQEAALALLLDSQLPKTRLLEIYLNVIEWGPDVHGLRGAACHYFGKEPAELSPRESAFLVALIPGPVKYQKSILGGVVSPRFGFLVNGILAKLRSVDVLSDEEYAAALADPLAFTEAAVEAAQKAPVRRPSADVRSRG